MRSYLSGLPAIMSYGPKLEFRVRARNSLTRSDPTEPKVDLNSSSNFDLRDPKLDTDWLFMSRKRGSNIKHGGRKFTSYRNRLGTGTFRPNFADPTSKMKNSANFTTCTDESDESYVGKWSNQNKVHRWRFLYFLLIY